MRLTLALCFFTLSGCASTVVPVLGDAGPSDVPIAFDVRDVTTDTTIRPDVPPTCPGFETLCSGRCVDTQNDPANCGGCGRACSAGTSCLGGMCTMECVMPRLECNGRCVDILSDSSNCGGCGIACGDSVCVSGSCQSRCPVGTTPCGTRCVDLLDDVANCGGCDHACSTVAHGMPVCASGSCGFACQPGFAACGTQCVDPDSDPNNCGACGNTCPAGASCVASMCRVPMRPPPGAYPIAFAPVATTGTGVANADDTVSGLVPIGFSFRFFTNTYTQVNISSNGLIGFDAMFFNGCCTGRPIPMADMMNNMIAAAWTDLYPPGSPLAPNAVTYETRGSAPDRTFVVSWTNVPWCCAGSMGSVTTQIVLHETTDAIDIFTTSQTAGHMYTQGAENAAGSIAYFIPGRSAASYSLTNDGVRIYTY